jgi:hypothetical protein
MGRLIRFTVGLLTFLAAHAVEVLEWSVWFGGAHPPWFLNSGRAIAFTLGCVCISSCIVTLGSASARRVRGITFAVGSFVAMTAVMFLQKGGAGSIFPIVMVVGGLFILMSSTFGAFIGAEIRLAVRGRT